MELIISAIGLGILAALNLTARANDAVRIVTPEPGLLRTQLLRSTQKMIYFLISITAVVAFVVTAIEFDGSNLLIILAFTLMLAGTLAVYFCIRSVIVKEPKLKELTLDTFARHVGTKTKLGGDKMVILVRLALAMLRVWIFFIAVLNLIRNLWV